MFELLKTLSEIPGPVGREERVHGFLRERWRERGLEATIDAVGNLTARVGGSGPKLLLLGHGDEIGFAVRHISDDGFLFLSSGQRLGVDRPEMRGSYTLPTGQPALVVTRHGAVEGVFATLTGHILSQRQREATGLEWSDLWVDVFAESRAEVEARGIRVGDRVIWNPPLRRQGDYIYGKALDNRVALAILDALLERIDPAESAYELYIASSVQEEIGLIGAHSINRAIGARYAIALDIALSGDVPGVARHEVETRLGGGPVLIYKDLYAYSAPLTDALADTAEEAGIPYQRAVFGIFGSDAGALMREGVAAAMLGVPTRYTHSPFETLRASDLERTVELLAAFVRRGPDFIGEDQR
jgi:putative aminopeptidase FrvX